MVSLLRCISYFPVELVWLNCRLQSKGLRLGLLNTTPILTLVVNIICLRLTRHEGHLFIGCLDTASSHSVLALNKRQVV